MINSILKYFISKRVHRIYDVYSDLKKVQEEQLFSILTTSEKTVFGKEYDFENIKTIKDFQSKVPLHTYESIFPYIEKMLEGQESVLYPGLVKWFSKSSGTTNAKSKYIPVSDKALVDCHFKGGEDELSLYLKAVPESELFKGKILCVGGSFSKSTKHPDIFIGDVSAVTMKELPLWAEYFRTPSLNTALMSEWESKLDQMALESMNENVTGIAGVPTWTIVLIKKILEKTGKENILEVWPNLEVFFHGAVSFDPYRHLFKELIPKDNMHYMEAYNASEGFFAIQDDLSKDNEMLLMPDYGIFYEFVPVTDPDKSHPVAYTMLDVKIGKNYAMIISTNGGLFRYVIGDTVMFTSLFPHRIKITGRTKHYLNTFGEELVVHNADTAILQACLATGAKIVDYTAGPIFMTDDSRGGHEWIIEFSTLPISPSLFIFELDKNLKMINSDYDAKRYKNIALQEPVLKIAPEGTFHKWMKEKNKLGGQNKVPRLSNTREFLYELNNLI